MRLHLNGRIRVVGRRDVHESVRRVARQNVAFGALLSNISLDGRLANDKTAPNHSLTLADIGGL